MVWLTEQLPNCWYVFVTCEKCKSQAIVSPDLTEGKGDFSLAYFFSCDDCQHEGTYAAGRYWYAGPDLAEVT